MVCLNGLLYSAPFCCHSWANYKSQSLDYILYKTFWKFRKKIDSESLIKIWSVCTPYRLILLVCAENKSPNIWSTIWRVEGNSFMSLGACTLPSWLRTARGWKSGLFSNLLCKMEGSIYRGVHKHSNFIRDLRSDLLRNVYEVIFSFFKCFVIFLIVLFFYEVLYRNS